MTTQVNVAAQNKVERGDTNTADIRRLGDRLSRYGKEAVRFSIAGVLGWILISIVFAIADREV